MLKFALSLGEIKFHHTGWDWDIETVAVGVGKNRHIVHETSLEGLPLVHCAALLFTPPLGANGRRARIHVVVKFRVNRVHFRTSRSRPRHLLLRNAVVLI